MSGLWKEFYNALSPEELRFLILKESAQLEL